MNVLIIDDEFYIVKGLIENTDWLKLGIQKTFQAYSARQAKIILKGTENIDIVITDIEMPRESGLELVAWMQENNLHPVTIVLTGHQRFDYAKQALDLHIFSYLLKPVNYDDLEEKLSAAILEAKRSHLRMEEELSITQELVSDPGDFTTVVKQYIQKNLGNTELNRTLIADEIHMNPDYMSHLFHKKAGISLSNYILDQRIHYAKKLLSTTNLSIQQISEKCGFSGISYFHRQFKKLTNQTPQHYRDLYGNHN